MPAGVLFMHPPQKNPPFDCLSSQKGDFSYVDSRFFMETYSSIHPILRAQFFQCAR